MVRGLAVSLSLLFVACTPSAAPVASTTSGVASTCPPAGSGSAGVAAHLASTCGPNDEASAASTTCNGEFTVSFAALTTSGPVFTATLEVCKRGRSPAVKDLSHADLDLTGLLGCQAPGTTLAELFLGCRVLAGGGTCTLASPDPTTGVIGVKVDGVQSGDGCLRVEIDLDPTHTQPGFSLGAGPAYVATKAGPEDIRNPKRTTPGYACVVGPACVPIDTNRPPVASAGGPYTTREGELLTLAGTASDPDGDPLSFAWDLDGDGAFDDATGPTATHAFLLEGTQVVAVRVTDGRGGEATATALVTVTNAPPTAASDFATAREDEAAIVDVLANDSDPSPADVLTIVSVTQPEGGLATLLADGRVEVRLEPDASGVVRFTYTISDGTDLATAEVEVTFLAAPDAVTALDVTKTLPEDSVLTVPAEAGVRTHVFDLDGDPVTLALAAPPSHGTLDLDLSTGAYRYAPNPDFHGDDAFTVLGTHAAETATATVHLLVTPVNDAPRAAADAYAIDEDSVLTVPLPGLLANDLDPDGDPLATVLVSSPDFARLFLTPDGGFVLVPDPDFHGVLTFTYVATDLFGASGFRVGHKVTRG